MPAFLTRHLNQYIQVGVVRCTFQRGSVYLRPLGNSYRPLSSKDWFSLELDFILNALESYVYRFLLLLLGHDLMQSLCATIQIPRFHYKLSRYHSIYEQCDCYYCLHVFLIMQLLLGESSAGTPDGSERIGNIQLERVQSVYCTIQYASRDLYVFINAWKAPSHRFGVAIVLLLLTGYTYIIRGFALV